MKYLVDLNQDALATKLRDNAAYDFLSNIFGGGSKQIF